jgi:hypothetical protein
MIGAHYGFIPEGDEHSVVELQYAEAAAEAASMAAAIVWIAPGAATAQEPRIKGLIDRVKENPPRRGSWDVLVNQDLDRLKALVLDRLNPAPAVPAGPSGAPIVYLMCDRLDHDDGVRLRDALLEQSVDVRLPLLEGSAEDIRRDHYETLTQCDAVLLYWGKSSEGWLRSMLRDMKKVFGLGRTNPYRAASIYLAQLPDAKKEAFRTLDLTVLRASGDTPTEILRPFVHALSA